MVASRKSHNLFIVLTGIFLTNARLAEIIGVKIFSGEKTLGFDSLDFSIGNFPVQFNYTAGVIIWPIVFLSTDIINEYFGKRGVRKISFIAAAFIAYTFFVFFLITKLAPADFWLDVNAKDQEGNYFDINYAFNTIFTQGLGIIVGSLLAFLLGQLLDVFIFQRLRRITGSKMIWLRATGSTLVSQLIDSFVVLWIAFFVMAPAETRWPWSQLIVVGLNNYIYKFVVAIVLTPLIYLGHYLIDLYLGKELAEEMTEKAAKESEGFL